ncbi:MAG: hypothetical protein EOP45_05490 [Sphingobacteriaceae bacterium]|nr:MAG: hypothetical protein EOP45_05490 [Sphingobacteriaceae bacterium]
MWSVVQANSTNYYAKNYARLGDDYTTYLGVAAGYVYYSGYVVAGTTSQCCGWVDPVFKNLFATDYGYTLVSPHFNNDDGSLYTVTIPSGISKNDAIAFICANAPIRDGSKNSNNQYYADGADWGSAWIYDASAGTVSYNTLI